MTEEKTTREMIVETNRDVKWICRTLAEMKQTDGEIEQRLRALEDWQHTKMGEEQRLQRIGAGAGGLMGGVVAVVVRFLWGG
jgi:hypothetical protein